MTEARSATSSTSGSPADSTCRTRPGSSKRWAGHIREGLGAIRVDDLERDDVARWLDGLADAVDAGELRRSPAARVGMPRQVAKVAATDKPDRWSEDEMRQFFAAIIGHRWEGPLRLAMLYGLRHSELLGLRWAVVDLRKGTVRIERA